MNTFRHQGMVAALEKFAVATFKPVAPAAPALPKPAHTTGTKLPSLPKPPAGPAAAPPKAPGMPPEANGSAGEPSRPDALVAAEAVGGKVQNAHANAQAMVASQAQGIKAAMFRFGLLLEETNKTASPLLPTTLERYSKPILPLEYLGAMGINALIGGGLSAAAAPEDERLSRGMGGAAGAAAGSVLGRFAGNSAVSAPLGAALGAYGGQLLASKAADFNMKLLPEEKPVEGEIRPDNGRTFAAVARTEGYDRMNLINQSFRSVDSNNTASGQTDDALEV